MTWYYFRNINRSAFKHICSNICKGIVAIFLVIHMPGSLRADITNPLDSIVRQTDSITDLSKKSEKLIEAAKAYYSKTPELARQILDYADRVAKKSKSEISQVISKLVLAEYFVFTGKNDSSRLLLKRLKEKESNYTNPKSIIHLYLCLASRCRFDGQTDSSFTLINRAIDISKANNDYRMDRLLIERGAFYSNHGQYNKTISDYYAALSLIDTSKHAYRIWLLNLIAREHLNMNQLSQAKEIYQKANEASQGLGLTNPDSWYGFGIIFFRQNMPDSSLFYFRKMVNNYTSKWGQNYIYTNSLFHIWKINIQKHNRMHHQIFREFNEQFYDDLYSPKQPFLISMFAEMLIHYKEYDKAEAILFNGLRQIGQSQKVLLNSYYYWISEVKERKGEHAEALKYYKKYKNRSDSTRNLEAQKEISFLKEQFDANEREAEINKLNHLNEQKSLEAKLMKSRLNNGLVISALTILVLIALGFVFRLRQKARVQKLHKLNHEKENEIRIIHEKNKTNIMKSYIKGQEKERNRLARELHDDVGARLAAIRYFLQAKSELFANEDQQQIKNELSALHKIIRNVSHKLIKPEYSQITLPELISEQLKWIPDQKAEVNFICRDQINWIKIPEKIQTQIYRIVQESLNNSLKYAQAENILIQIRKRNELLELEIADDGIGFSTKEIQKTGIGIKNMETRARSIGARFEIISTPDEGTRVITRIPLN